MVATQNGRRGVIMTYLELCKRLWQEVGDTGSGKPATTIGQTGEMKRICTWVNQAWVEIQEYRQDWEWLRKNVSFATVAAQNSYSPTTDILLTDFASWRTDGFRIYQTAGGVGNQILLQQYDYTSFRDYYLLGARQITQGRPIAISVAPNKDLFLGLVPDQSYTVTGEYFSVPTNLDLDADTPVMPTRFHMAIVYKAMMMYAAFESAPEVMASASSQYSAMINRLESDQTPPILNAPALI